MVNFSCVPKDCGQRLVIVLAKGEITRETKKGLESLSRAQTLFSRTYHMIDRGFGSMTSMIAPKGLVERMHPRFEVSDDETQQELNWKVPLEGRGVS